MSTNFASKQQVVKTTGKGGEEGELKKKKQEEIVARIGTIRWGGVFYNFLQLQQILLL